MSIILFLVILALLVLVHEFGHFIIAKKSGIRVDEFGLGFPPKLFGYKKGETEYTFNAIPFGGFVKIFGETPDEESLRGPDSARSLINKPKWIQAAVMAGGVFFNVVFAWLLISIGFMVGLPTPIESAPAGAIVEDQKLTILTVRPDSPADDADLKGGDVIVAMSSGADELTDVSVSGVQNFINTHGGQEIDILVNRGEKAVSLSTTPVGGLLAESYAIGISLDVVGTVTLPIHLALWEGAKMTWALTVAVVVAFSNLIAGLFSGSADLSSVSGPVGIVGVVGDAANIGFVYLISLTALISLNLAVLNLLPIPALDGGRLLFLAIEAIKGSPMNPRIINRIHTIGFILLLLLMVIVTYSDIVKLF